MQSYLDYGYCHNRMMGNSRLEFQEGLLLPASSLQEEETRNLGDLESPKGGKLHSWLCSFCPASKSDTHLSLLAWDRISLGCFVTGWLVLKPDYPLQVGKCLPRSLFLAERSGKIPRLKLLYTFGIFEQIVYCLLANTKYSQEI